MCLVALAWQVDPSSPLILLANRDEFFERPSAPLAEWESQTAMIAGRDLQAGGTWLGFNRQNRRLAVVTNVRETKESAAGSLISRGSLVSDFLLGSAGAEPFARRLWSEGGQRYEGYNLLLFDGSDAFYVSNRAGVERLPAGVHGLSNAQLNTPWPKVDKVKSGLRLGIERGHSIGELEELFRDTGRAEDFLLPHTGVPIEWERRLSSVFIDGDPSYGTRALTSVRVADSGEVCLREWSRPSLSGDWSLVEIEA